MVIRRSLIAALAAISFVPFPSVAQSPAPSLSVISPTSPQVARSSIADLLPKDASGVFLINTEAARWEELSRFGLFPADFSFPGALYPTEIDVEFARDVKPWLGDQIGIALLSSRSSIIIASVKDATSIAPYLDRVKAARKKPVQTSQYKGIEILAWESEPIFSPSPDSEPIEPSEKATSPKPASIPTAKPKPETPSESKETGFRIPALAIAVLPGYIVSANSTTAIQQLIDAQAGERLTNNPSFQRTVQNPKYARSLFVGYGNYIDIVKAANSYNQERANQLPPGFPKAPTIDDNIINSLDRYYDTMDGYVWSDANGLHMQVGLNLKQSIPEAWISSLTSRNELLERLPEVNYMVTNSYNLSLFWRMLTVGLESQPSFKKTLDQFRQFAQGTIGVDDRDLFPWMTGEYAMFMYPTRKGLLPRVVPNLDLGLGFMVQTNDRAAADAALNKLDQSFKTRFGQNLVNQRTVAGQPAIEIGELPFLSHSWLDKDTLLVVAGGGAINELSPKPNRTLPQSANFKAAMAPFQLENGSLSEPNMGYFYVNNGAVMALVNSTIAPWFSSGGSTPYFDQFREVWGSVRSISGVSRLTPNRLETDGYLAIATTRKPVTERKSSQAIDSQWLEKMLTSLKERNSPLP